MTGPHKNISTSRSDWTAGAIAEARVDPVGLWALIQDAQYRFELKDDSLAAFIGQTIVALLEAGAVPVVGDFETKRWRRSKEYGQGVATVSEAILREWKASSKPPDVDGIWFAFPSVFEESN